MKIKFLWVVVSLLSGVNFSIQAATSKSIHPNGKPFMIELQKRVYANWEPIGSDEVQVKFKVNRADGVFKEISIVKRSSNEKHNFACIEAVRTSSGFWKYPPVENSSEVYIKFLPNLDHCNFECSKLYAKTKGPLSDNDVVVHLIPIDVLQTYKNIDSNVIHSVKNLRVIDLKKFSVVEFEKFRSDWIVFFRSNESMTESRLSSKAKELETRYVSLFGSEETGPIQSPQKSNALY